MGPAPYPNPWSPGSLVLAHARDVCTISYVFPADAFGARQPASYSHFRFKASFCDVTVFTLIVKPCCSRGWSRLSSEVTCQHLSNSIVRVVLRTTNHTLQSLQQRHMWLLLSLFAYFPKHPSLESTCTVWTLKGLHLQPLQDRGSSSAVRFTVWVALRSQAYPPDGPRFRVLAERHSTDDEAVYFEHLRDKPHLIRLTRETRPPQIIPCGISPPYFPHGDDSLLSLKGASESAYAGRLNRVRHSACVSRVSFGSTEWARSLFRAHQIITSNHYLLLRECQTI